MPFVIGMFYHGSLPEKNTKKMIKKRLGKLTIFFLTIFLDLMKLKSTII